MSPDITAFLISAGADVRAVNSYGLVDLFLSCLLLLTVATKTPLHNMALNGAVQSMELLLQNGADVHATDVGTPFLAPSLCDAFPSM